MAQRLKTDWILFLTVVAMFITGLLMVYSASSVMAGLRYGDPWHYAERQLMWAALGLAVMMVLKGTDYHKLRNPVVAFGAVGVVVVLLGIVYAVDPHHRWLRLAGPIGVQPSELAKPALAVFLAFFVTWRKPAINTRYTLGPAAMAVGMVIVAVVVADLGTAVVLGAAAAVVFFVAGLNWRWCLIAAGVSAIGVAGFVVSEPYRMARVVKFVDPEFKIVARLDSGGWIKAHLDKSLTARDTNYQLQQSKIAVGAGGVMGLGLMNGRQKLLYLPKAHNDFIYAVAGEEFGLLGTAGLLVGFMLILWRGLRTAWRITDDFGRYLALAVTALVVVQGLIHMSVVLGLVPTKGIPLPLISYGGSSVVSTLACLGLLMNVSEHAG